MTDHLDAHITLVCRDIGDGDHTTFRMADAIGKSQLIIKEEGILAGVEVAKRVFHLFDSDLK